jgi:hypothetical protein
VDSVPTHGATKSLPATLAPRDGQARVSGTPNQKMSNAMTAQAARKMNAAE